MRHQSIFKPAVILLILAASAGCGGGGGGAGGGAAGIEFPAPPQQPPPQQPPPQQPPPQQPPPPPVLPQPPTIANISANPTRLARFTGGPVILSAAVTSQTTINSVVAMVVRQRDGQLLATIAMASQVVTQNYEGTVAAPANTRNDGRSEVYVVTITATDSINQQTTASNAITFEVPSPLAAPGPPVLNRSMSG